MTVVLVGTFTAIYAIAFLVLVATEFYALGRPGTGDTITAHWRELRRSPLVWAAVPAVTWVFFHFVVPWEPDGVAFNDVAYIALGFALALWNVIYRQRRS